jgi:ribosomal-protein-alanine N-acetyltransferase
VGDDDGTLIAVGERVALRRPTAADEREFTALMRASRDLHRPWAYPPGDPIAYAAYMARLERDDYDGFLAVGRTTGAILGHLNLSHIVRGSLQSASLSYNAGQAFAGRGLMAEALRLLIPYAFGPLGLHRIEASVQPGNEPSLALLRSCGFRHEGFSPRFLYIAGAWRDHERFALTAEDWDG